MTYVPFQPAYGSGQTVTAGASATVTVNATDRQVCITNTGAAVGYVRMASGAATAADYPIPPGAQVIITKGDQTTLAYFSATSTTLHIMTGNGY